MPPRFGFSPLVLIAGMLVLAAGAVHGELLKVSPFLPPQGAGAAPTANAPLEYRGSLEMDAVEEYRVVDPARKVGSWLKIGEKDSNLDVVIKQHDDSNETLTIEHGGQTMTLPLHVSKVVASAGMPQMLPPPPQSNMLPAVTQTVVLNPTQADEQRRLEAVAAEVARRRALREQAAQAAQQGAPAPAPAATTRQDLQSLQQQQYQQQQYQRNYGQQRGNRPNR